MSGFGVRLGRDRAFILRFCLTAVEILVGTGAVYGAVILVTDGWRLPATDLDPLPLHSWILPGIALFVLVALPMAVAAFCTWLDLRRAPELSIAVGSTLIAWSLLQLLVLGPQTWLQAVMLGCGLLITGLGWLWLRFLRPCPPVTPGPAGRRYELRR
jgi:hypothetical protein